MMVMMVMMVMQGGEMDEEISAGEKATRFFTRR